MRFFLFFLVLVNIARAQELGVSYLAQARFSARSCTLALKVFSGIKNPTFEFLWGTFGNSKTCVDRFIHEHPDGTVLIDATNETCRRAPRYCAAGEINKHLRAAEYNRTLARKNRSALRALSKRLASILAYTRKHPDTKFLITFGLEDNFDARAFAVIESIYRAFFTKDILIRNHYANTLRDHSVYVSKLHGFDIPRNRKAYIFSNDGIDLDSTAARRSLRHAYLPAKMFGLIRAIRGDTNRIIMWWNTQGIVDGKFVEPRKRNIRIYHEDIILVNKFLRSLQNER